MDQLDRIDELPAVEDVYKHSYEVYQNYSLDVLKYKEFCQYGLAESIKKVQDWCIHLQCLSPLDPCVPMSDAEYKQKQIKLITSLTSSYINISSPVNQSIPNSSSISIFEYMQQIGNNTTGCYDDYICDKPYNSYPNHCILGVVCFTLCLCGIISNLVIFPAYNFGLNRSGATIYLSAMALFDCIFMGLSLLINVVHYLPSSFVEQMEMYGQFSGYLIPYGLPVFHICELLVVWLTIALLVNRLLYLKWGPHSKSLCSQVESVKIVTAIFLLCIAYMGGKFFEYTYVEYPEKKVVRVLFTQLGKMEMFRDIMDNWLKVPLEMFLPYLACGLLITIIVLKMVNLHTSKWKAVASLCNDTACACVCRTGVCGKECREGVKSNELSKSCSSNFNNQESSGKITTTTKQSTPDKNVTYQKSFTTANDNITNLDPIEQELTYLFFQLPQLDETRENANVITTVCIGLILLICKIPKFLLHIISTENYITYDPEVFRMINQLLDTMFAACKPMICILVGAHYRQALTTPSKCCPPNDNTTVTTTIVTNVIDPMMIKDNNSEVITSIRSINVQSTVVQQPEIVTTEYDVKNAGNQTVLQ
ncbi:FMRFamide receptor isoform X1 isoform 1 [Schistosoma japonicum]|uniref:FMRFamide receptor isoform X1 isoform 1 n=2 Tax=Schistosoma japonicum TaxID=6182 RepID=A0A4Z2DMT2_SCHJA|nr:FMRFamide receptor isoform X1 isoform 1 [Schistosoma japonicum]